MCEAYVNPSLIKSNKKGKPEIKNNVVTFVGEKKKILEIQRAT